MKSLLNGNVYNHNIDGWSVTWESNLGFRHWCYQMKDLAWENLMVVMFNPGSLSGDGSNLSKDTTLRILREVCKEANLNPFVINLFDYSSPSPQVLFDNWKDRDPEDLVFNKLSLSEFRWLIYAYGDYENWGQQDGEIKERQYFVKEVLGSIPEIDLPKNKSGTPKHPIIWQRQKIKDEIACILRNRA